MAKVLIVEKGTISSSSDSFHCAWHHPRCYPQWHRLRCFSAIHSSSLLSPPSPRFYLFLSHHDPTLACDSRIKGAPGRIPAVAYDGANDTVHVPVIIDTFKS